MGTALKLTDFSSIEMCRNLCSVFCVWAELWLPKQEPKSPQKLSLALLAALEPGSAYSGHAVKGFPVVGRKETKRPWGTCYMPGTLLNTFTQILVLTLTALL